MLLKTLIQTIAIASIACSVHAGHGTEITDSDGNLVYSRDVERTKGEISKSTTINPDNPDKKGFTRTVNRPRYQPNK